MRVLGSNVRKDQPDCSGIKMYQRHHQYISIQFQWSISTQPFNRVLLPLSTVNLSLVDGL